MCSAENHFNIHSGTVQGMIKLVDPKPWTCYLQNKLGESGDHLEVACGPVWVSSADKG